MCGQVHQNLLFLRLIHESDDVDDSTDEEGIIDLVVTKVICMSSDGVNWSYLRKLAVWRSGDKNIIALAFAIVPRILSQRNYKKIKRERCARVAL